MKLSRRQLLANTGIALATAGLCSRSLQAATPERSAGIQLWSVRREVAADPAGTLQTIADIGYRTVETAGTANLPAAEFRKLLDAQGLVCVSAHQSFDVNNLQQTLDDANALGARYTTAGLLRPGTGALPASGSEAGFMGTLHNMSADDARITAELCNTIGAAARKSGLTFAYHNHFFEFADTGNGQSGFDILLQETDPALVAFEIDCGWMAVAGHDPVAWLDRLGARFPLLHIKDFLPAPPQGGPADRHSTELGNGVIAYAPILAAAARAGVAHYLIEQEDPFTRLTPLEAARANYAYLTGLLQQ